MRQVLELAPLGEIKRPGLGLDSFRDRAIDAAEVFEWRVPLSPHLDSGSCKNRDAQSRNTPYHVGGHRSRRHCSAQFREPLDDLLRCLLCTHFSKRFSERLGKVRGAFLPFLDQLISFGLQSLDSLFGSGPSWDLSSCFSDFFPEGAQVPLLAEEFHDVIGVEHTHIELGGHDQLPQVVGKIFACVAALRIRQSEQLVGASNAYFRSLGLPSLFENY